MKSFHHNSKPDDLDLLRFQLWLFNSTQIGILYVAQLVRTQITYYSDVLGSKPAWDLCSHSSLPFCPFPAVTDQINQKRHMRLKQ